MAKFTDVFTEQVERPASSKTKTRKIQFIHYTKLMDSSYQYRSRDREKVISLADLIKADGEILEPCIVRKSGAGSDAFELIAGHKRTLAAKYLVEEEQLEEFAFIPCIEKSFSDIRAEFAVYSTNGYDEKTPYEIMREIEGMSRLLKEYPEEFPEYAGKGRLVEKLADKMKMSRSVISDYQNISHNLGSKGMTYFEGGKIDKSAAVTLASMPEEKQEEILDQGLRKREEIKSYAAKQIKEPSCKEVVTFFYQCGREELAGMDPADWAEILKENYGRPHSGRWNDWLRYDCSLRGIKFDGCDEITWKRFVSLLAEYLPEDAYKKTEEENPACAQEETLEETHENDGKPEDSIFDLTIAELLTKMNVNKGFIQIKSSNNAEKPMVWRFKKEGNHFIADESRMKEEEVLPGQMNVEEVLKSISNTEQKVNDFLEQGIVPGI